MMSGNMGVMDRVKYCCLRSIKLHIALIIGLYLYNIVLLPCQFVPWASGCLTTLTGSEI